jgi:hypothetical protein
MFCSKCGKDLSDVGGNFCLNCGAVIAKEPVETPTPSKPKEEKGKLLISANGQESSAISVVSWLYGVLFIVVVIAGFVCAHFFGSESVYTGSIFSPQLTQQYTTLGYIFVGSGIVVGILLEIMAFHMKTAIRATAIQVYQNKLIGSGAPPAMSFTIGAYPMTEFNLSYDEINSVISADGKMLLISAGYKEFSCFTDNAFEIRDTINRIKKENS